MAEIPKMKLKMCHPLCDCHQCQVIKDDLDFKLGQPTSLDDLLKIHNDHGYTGERDWIRKKFSSFYTFLHLTFPSHLPFIFFSSFSSLSFPFFPFSPTSLFFFFHLLSIFSSFSLHSCLLSFNSFFLLFSSFSSFSFPSFPLTLPLPLLHPSSSSPHPPPTALHASCMLGHDDVTTWLLSNSSSAVKAKTLKQGAINRSYK